MQERQEEPSEGHDATVKAANNKVRRLFNFWIKTFFKSKENSFAATKKAKSRLIFML